MATNTKTTTKRRNPPDATHRNVRAARAATGRVKAGVEKKLTVAVKQADQQMKALADELSKALQRIEKLENGQASAFRRHDELRHSTAKLADRVLTLEGRTESEVPTAEAGISSAAKALNKSLTPDQLAALSQKAATRETLTTERLAEPAKKSAKRKAVRS